MAKRVKKRRLKIGRVLTTICLLILIGFTLTKIIKFTESKLIINEYYVAATTNIVPIYAYNEENDTMDKADNIINKINYWQENIPARRKMIGFNIHRGQ